MGELNARQVESAKNDGSADFVTLKDGNGLELRVRSSGLKTWLVRYQFQGKRKTPSIGEYPSMSLAKAREAAEDMQRLLRNGICPVESAKAQSLLDEAKRIEEAAERARLKETARIEHESRRLFGDTLQTWADLALASRKDGGKETMRRLTKDVLPCLADKELGKVTKAELLNILDRVKLRGNVLANHVFGDLRQFFNWCYDRELIEKHPLQGINKAKVGGAQPERERVLSMDEIKMLRDQLPAAFMERQTELAIWLMISTLARVGELTQARWEHIDMQAGTWTIPADNAKNARKHIIYLSEFSKRHFAELKTINFWSEWCFPSTRNDGHLCLRSISKQIKDRQRDTALSNRSLKGLGALTLPGGGWTPHDLRRTGSTIMKKLKVASDVIERCLNHVEASKLKRIYQRYDHEDEQCEAWARLGEQLDALLYNKGRTVIPMIRKAA